MTSETSAHASTLPTPNGPFTVVVSPASDAVLAAGWTADAAALRDLIHPLLRPADLRQVSPRDMPKISGAVSAYYDGDLSAVSTVAVEQLSGQFIAQAWKVLRDVAPGAPVTYQMLADRAGNPSAVRAAAAACARNAAALFVPCHRVVRTGGGLGGFRWGLQVKSWLLRHEEETGSR